MKTTSSSTHALSPTRLEHLVRVMRFNWCVAAHAHPDWREPWQTPNAPTVASSRPSMRMLQRMSRAMLIRENLMRRHLDPAHPHSPWLVLSRTQLRPLAHTLGLAMLGGWVRNSLEREQVAQQLQVLGPQGRASALQYAHTLSALPFSQNGQGWPLSALAPAAVEQLGLACLAALLAHDAQGCQTRFLMRFAANSIAPITLSTLQRSEACALISAHIVTETSN
jgi:hypothetical protein